AGRPTGRSRLRRPPADHPAPPGPGPPRRHGRARPAVRLKKRRAPPVQACVCARGGRSTIAGGIAFAYRFVKSFPPVTLRLAASRGRGLEAFVGVFSVPRG